MKLTIQDNFPIAQQAIKDLGKQALFATAVALTRTAQDVRAAEREQIASVFDRPTPYALNALYLQPATKATLRADVWIKDDTLTSGTPAIRFLLPHIEGGKRELKTMERMLQRIGAMPRGWFAVPAAAAKIDAFGNMNRGQITQILSYLQAFGEQGYSANTTKEKRAKLAKSTKSRRGIAYFVSSGKLRPKTKHLAAGIWMRTTFAGLGTSIKPVLLFVPRAEYRKRFPFHQVAQEVAERRFPSHFNRALAEALATARPSTGATP